MTTPAPVRISSGRDVIRHVAPVPASDIVVVHGIRCTSLKRTVFDMMRRRGPEASVVAADAAERQFALRGRVWHEDAVGYGAARRVSAETPRPVHGGFDRRGGSVPSPTDGRSCPVRA